MPQGGIHVCERFVSRLWTCTNVSGTPSLDIWWRPQTRPLRQEHRPACAWGEGPWHARPRRSRRRWPAPRSSGRTTTGAPGRAGAGASAVLARTPLGAPPCTPACALVAVSDPPRRVHGSAPQLDGGRGGGGGVPGRCWPCQAGGWAARQAEGRLDGGGGRPAGQARVWWRRVDVRGGPGPGVPRPCGP